MKFEDLICWVVLGSAMVGIVYAFCLIGYVYSKPEGPESIKAVGRAIREGAKAYLFRQFKALILFVCIIAVGLYIATEDEILKLPTVLAFLMGALFSALTGFVGMTMAVRGNTRTAQAARESYKKALMIAFRTGSITGMLCVGLGLLGATVIYMLYKERAMDVLVGFGFGGCLLALFMRVGGGIYTKAADVGADLVGKVEKGIPEDDPRNPATIADNVGDNVGDCAGMAADLFESYEVTLVAAMILGYTAFGAPGLLFPLIVRAIGVWTSILGTYLVRAWREDENAMWSIQRAFIISTLASAALTYPFAVWYLKDIRAFWATFFGIILAVCISLLTEYFTTTERQPVKEIAKSTQTGPATTILSGLAVGMESSVWAILIIGATIGATWLLFGGDLTLALYGVSLCGLGMLTTTGVVVSMDSYGPVTDNAHGIQEMAGIKEKKTEEITTRLDAVGNTTKAITKGFAIATAVVAAVSLFSSYIEVALSKGVFSYISQEGSGHFCIRIDLPPVFIGLLIGGAIPFLFSAFMVRAVGRGAYTIIQEVRKQFAEKEGLLESKVKPDYGRCVDICTATAQKELIGPGIMAICTPILVGFMFGPEALGAFLGGIILSGQLLAVFMANAGGAWDNAKKLIEHGAYGGKGTDCHKAGVIGDTVGDPLKDTSGPALNPLIKVMNLVALIILPVVLKWHLATSGEDVNWVGIVVSICAVGLLIFAIIRSKKEAWGKAAGTYEDRR